MTTTIEFPYIINGHKDASRGMFLYACKTEADAIKCATLVNESLSRTIQPPVVIAKVDPEVALNTPGRGVIIWPKEN